MEKYYTGINIQYPISELILSGEKTVETRTYPLPEKYLNTEMLLVETPGPIGEFKARIRAILIFEKCFKYRNKADFYSDKVRHLVEPSSPWAWKEKEKWGWEFRIKKILGKPQPVIKKRGIVYTTKLKLKP